MYKTVSQRLQRGREREKSKREPIPDLPEIPPSPKPNRKHTVADHQWLVPLVQKSVKTGIGLRELAVPKWLRQEIAHAGGSQKWLRKWYLRPGRHSTEKSQRTSIPETLLVSSAFETNRRRH